MKSYGRQSNEAPHARYFDVLSRLASEEESLGEMVVVDGRFWRVPAAGAVREAADSYRRIGHLELTRAPLDKSC